MKRIGILGDIGSGKTYIAKCFGFPVFNADLEVAKIYKNNRKVFKKLRLVTISDKISTKPVFRANGLHRIALDDLQRSESLEGVVVLARTLLREDFSIVSRVEESKLLPHPVEIKPQCLISSDFKNLLLAGSSASCSELSSRSLSMPVVAAQMAIASAIMIVSAVSQNRLPKTICKGGYIDGL